VIEKLSNYFDSRITKIEEFNKIFWNEVDVIKLDLFFIKNEGKKKIE
jgi:hypothetical protein